jgi:urease accessory protein UreF
VSDHKTKYLLEAKIQDRYDQFAQVDDPERLEAELALARSLCEQAANAGHHALAASLLATIAKLSAATTAQKVRLGELLEKEAAFRLGKQLVDLVCSVIKDRFPGWEEALDQLANQITVAVEEADNEPEEAPKLLTYERHHP